MGYEDIKFQRECRLEDSVLSRQTTYQNAVDGFNDKSFAGNLGAAQQVISLGTVGLLKTSVAAQPREMQEALQPLIMVTEMMAGTSSIGFKLADAMRSAIKSSGAQSGLDKANADAKALNPTEPPNNEPPPTINTL